METKDVTTVTRSLCPGARVIIACRNMTKGAKALASIQAACPGAQVEVRELDLADTSSIRAFAQKFLQGLAFDWLALDWLALDGLALGAGPITPFQDSVFMFYVKLEKKIMQKQYKYNIYILLQNSAVKVKIKLENRPFRTILQRFHLIIFEVNL